MKIRRTLIAGLTLVVLSIPVVGQLKLPSPEQALSSPGMEKMTGVLFSRRFESGGFGGKPEILPPDAAQSQRVQKIVGRLSQAVAMDRPNVVLQAKVVRQNEVNAFCIPGGYIYVYSGLIDHIDRNHPENPDDALAAVLGHEIAHAVLRHGLKDWAKSKEFEKVLEDPQLFREVLMASSREQEFEADRYGALYSTRAGYEMSAAIDVFHKFPQSGHIYDRGLSSHPDGPERVAQLETFRTQLMTMVNLWDESFKALNSGRFDQAAIALEILEAEFPNLPSVHNNLGWAYYRQYEKGDPTPLKEHPSYAFVNELGIRVRGAADGDVVILTDAEDQFRQALQLNPDLIEAYEGAALCAIEKGEYESAASSLERAKTLDPKRSETLNLLGILALRTGQNETALENFQAALKGNEKFAPAMYNLALTHENLGQTELARENLNRFLAVEKEGHWARAASETLGQKVEVASAPRAKSLGGVEIGSSTETLVKSLGEPKASSDSLTELTRMDYPDAGLTVWVSYGTVRMIASDRTAPEAVSVKLGDEEQKVAQTLGQPTQKAPGPEGQTCWSYPSRGMAVSFREGRVSGFTISQL